MSARASRIASRAERIIATLCRYRGTHTHAHGRQRRCYRVDGGYAIHSVRCSRLMPSHAVYSASIRSSRRQIRESADDSAEASEHPIRVAGELLRLQLATRCIPCRCVCCDGRSPSPLTLYSPPCHSVPLAISTSTLLRGTRCRRLTNRRIMNAHAPLTLCHTRQTSRSRMHRRSLSHSRSCSVSLPRPLLSALQV
jgi:hypothetical protein